MSKLYFWLCIYKVYSYYLRNLFNRLRVKFLTFILVCLPFLNSYCAALNQIANGGLFNCFDGWVYWAWAMYLHFHIFPFFEMFMLTFFLLFIYPCLLHRLVIIHIAQRSCPNVFSCLICFKCYQSSFSTVHLSMSLTSVDFLIVFVCN